MEVLKVDYRNPEAPLKFVESLRNTGFAVIREHPIPWSLVSAVFAEWEKFFASDYKSKYLFDPKTQAGYFPFRTENAKGFTQKDLKEFFHIYSWSDIPREHSPNTRELFERMHALAMELLTWVERHSPEDVRRGFRQPLPSMMDGSRETLLRVIHYPPLKGSEEPGAIRAAAHEDINLITILPAATAPGLQVRDVAGAWHDVPVDPGSLAINAGDMLQMASGGYYKSTTHQVVNPLGEDSSKPRLSMPLFLHPHPDVRLSETHTARSYLHERLKEIGLK